jgi:hypothetical protein
MTPAQIYGLNSPLSSLGQPQQPTAPQQNLAPLGLGSVPEWQTLLPNRNTDMYNNNRFNYMLPELRPSPNNGAGITIADPNYQMQQQIWQNIYGRQIGGGGNL